jgi:tRNA/tmRNA/rRNA uracil-C5-methylase (TrmA/RlmC/RlmD family)
MSTPTTNDVIVTLAQLGRDLDNKQAEIARLDEDAVRARARYEVTHSRNFLKAEGAMDVRKHQAIVDTAELKLDAEIADQVLRAARESIRVLRDRLDIGRSLNSAIRSEWAAQPAGQVHAA